MAGGLPHVYAVGCGGGRMSAGHIILLNGSSSAGKTTLALMLQQILEAPYQHMALDQFRDGMPARYRGLNAPPGAPGASGLNVVPATLDGQPVTEVRFGAMGQRVLCGMRRAMAAFAQHGGNVIVDDLMLERAFLMDYLKAFDGLAVTFVGVRCPLHVANAREATRPGRFPGTAASHFHRVHEHCEYDVEVDTSMATPRQCAEQVAQAAAAPSGAFARLKAKFGVG